MTFRVDIMDVARGWDMTRRDVAEFETREEAIEFIAECNKDLPEHGLPLRYRMARGPFEVENKTCA